MLQEGDSGLLGSQTSGGMYFMYMIYSREEICFSHSTVSAEFHHDIGEPLECLSTQLVTHWWPVSKGRDLCGARPLRF